MPVPSEQGTVAAVLERLNGKTPGEELAAATIPAHLGRRSADVAELVEWAARHPQLDPGHRRGERAWHCVGQKVLSLRGARGGVKVKAGIHGSGPGNKPGTVIVRRGQPLAGSELADVQQSVEQGVAARLTGSFHKPDEHWLQAVIRRQPSLAGIEQPALRELPAWRPAMGKRRWGRGYVDLVGVDPHGDVRIVEIKLAANKDALLILQGVDYYIWAQAYADVLRQRLGAPKRSQLVLHYLVGATETGTIHLSPYAPTQAQALFFPWRIQTVSDWFHPPAAPGPATARLLPPRALPT